MDQLSDLIQKIDEESYRKAIELTMHLGRQAIPVLQQMYENNVESTVRSRVVKLMGSIEDSSVISFLKKALEDENFDVRRTAALSLKILADEDYFGIIYRSSIGRSLKRDFWCYVDFVDEAALQGYRETTSRLIDGFVIFFSNLAKGWTYPDPVSERYFSPDHKEPLKMAEDGHTLFKNYNYAIEKTLIAINSFLFLAERCDEVLKSDEGEQAELEDILRCMKQGLAVQLRELEESLGIFLAAFHFIRTEMNLSIRDKENRILPLPSESVTDDDRDFQKRLAEGFIRFPSFTGVNTDTFDPEWVAYNLILLKRQSIEFLKICEQFGTTPEIQPESDFLFKRLGLQAGTLWQRVLHLLSAWCKDE